MKKELYIVPIVLIVFIILFVIGLIIFLPSEKIETEVQGQEDTETTDGEGFLNYPSDHTTGEENLCSKECTKNEDCVIDSCLGCYNKAYSNDPACINDCSRPEKASCRCISGSCFTM